MASGVQATDECIEAYQKLKAGKKFTYIIYGLSPDYSSIVVLKTSQEKNFDKFIEELPEQECRWAVYDYEFTLPGGEGTRNKLCFVSWSPDTAKIKDKMLFASSRDALRRTLVGIHIEIQATEYSEITEEIIYQKATRR
ncbi:uncharacterized protein L203_100711 [Cryptococcus depauperatus CBS 7841]|uniref:Cofilin n=1 Tax=Cryptococcus depauperatus CBS 7841 TaxID=1295531 RepID=A0A1E3IZV0_9TREE|nr:cofilin [Cryptococcus depauperatus CBS 7841]